MKSTLPLELNQNGIKLQKNDTSLVPTMQCMYVISKREQQIIVFLFVDYRIPRAEIYSYTPDQIHLRYIQVQIQEIRKIFTIFKMFLIIIN